MIAIARGELIETTAVEFHAAEVLVIRVFIHVQAASEEPQLVLRFIDVQDLAHGPLPLRDLVLRLAGFQIVEPQMAPAVAFAHPDEFILMVQPVAPAFAGVVDEGL